MRKARIATRYLLLVLFIIAVSNIDNILTLPWFIYVIPFVYFGMRSINRLVPCFNTELAFAKNFEVNYREKKPNWKMDKSYTKPIIITISIWCAGLIGLGALYFTHVLSPVHIYIVFFIFHFLDAICLDIWCPFRIIFKNRCCMDCRINAWDQIFLVSPLIFVPSWFSLGLIALAIACVIVWEVAHHKHPERFENNANLKCSNCPKLNNGCKKMTKK